MATLHKLTAKAVEALSEPGRHSDGGGLYLVVRGPQSRSWVFIWKDKGRPREAGLGPAKGKDKDGITLSEARDRAAEFRTRLREGVDPLKAKEAERAASVTFGPFADEYLAGIKTSFKHPHSIADWKRDIEKRCAVLRPMVIADIGTDDVLEVLRPIWTTRHRTATELRGRIERILDAAKALGYRSGENPARWRGHLSVFLGSAKRKKRHHPAPPYKDMARIVAELRQRDTIADRALEFVILTALRTTEARAMRVSEIDFDARTATIPALRMKMPEDHVVPLSDRALALLRRMIPKDAKPGAYVFPGLKHGQCLGENAMGHALKRVAPGMTVHGCRSSFRDWCGDETDFPRETAEAALAHAVGNEVERAYRRGTALEKRRLLMAAWAKWCASRNSNKPVNVLQTADVA